MHSDSASKPTLQNLRWLRCAAGYAAILATVPYFALKLNWIIGGTIGMAQPSYFDNQTYFYANIITLGMDAVAVLIALAFSSAWGLRIPSLLILFPIWLASGFLLPTVVLLPLVVVTASWPARSGDPLQAWVYIMVYCGFAAQGVFLSLAFALYVKARWSRVLRQLRTVQMRTLAIKGSTLLTVAFGLVAGAVAAFHLLWAFGAGIGMRAEFIAQQTRVDYLAHGVYGMFAVSAAIGALVFGFRIRRGESFLMPLALTWVGTGAMVAWGAWLLLTGAASAIDAPGYFLVLLMQVLVATVLAFVLVRVLVSFST